MPFSQFGKDQSAKTGKCSKCRQCLSNDLKLRVKDLKDVYITNLIKQSLKFNPRTATNKEKQILINIYGSIENCIEFHRKSVQLKRELRNAQRFGTSS